MLLAATILVALGCPSPARALTVGFLDPTLQTQDNARFWSDMTTLRAGVVRYDAYWNEIAPTRPGRPRDPASIEYRWEVLDRLVVDAAAHSAEIVVTLWRTPRWARADGGRGGKPNLYSWAPRISDWRAFVYAAAVRYSGSFDADGLGYGGPLPRVRFWEVWNEPNYIGALRPQRGPGKAGKVGQPVSPTTYTALLNAAYAELGRVERERRVNLDIRFVGATPVPIPLREEKKFSLDVNELRDLVTDRTRLIILNSPQNPTGGILPRADLQAIAAIAVQHGIPVLSDEIYSRMVYDGEFHSITTCDGMQELGIILDGFSKTYAMTGWRLGYGVMPEELGLCM